MTTRTLYGKYNYIGDVNPEYGGTFYDVSEWKWGYVSAVRITDLDSGCGFRGAVLIEHVVVHGWNDKTKVQNALRCCGEARIPKDCKGLDRKLYIADCLMSYGYCDYDDGWNNYVSPSWEVVQCEADGPLAFEGWQSATRLPEGQTLLEYLEEKHLNESFLVG